MSSSNPVPNNVKNDLMRGKPYHDSETAELQKLLKQKIAIDNKAKSSQDSLYKKEGQYLEETPNGNILIGFEGYLSKGTQRRNRDIDSLRVFSKPYSSLTEAVDSPASSVATPSHAPTPVSMSINKAGDSGGMTPTSSTSGARSKRATKRGDEDSEVEVKETKKARISATNSRK